MAVQRLFLSAVGLHCHFLHADDLRDAEEEERRPNRPQWPPQTGLLIARLHLVSIWSERQGGLQWWTRWFIELAGLNCTGMRCFGLQPGRSRALSIASSSNSVVVTTTAWKRFMPFRKKGEKKEHLPLRVCHQNVPFQFPNGREGQGHTMSQITLHSKVETAPKKNVSS